MQAKKVDFFVGRMNRLKSGLGVSKDKEVAEFLGLTDKALNARKARGSFPEAELIALAEAQPQLQLNLDYILEGDASAQESKGDFEGRLERTSQLTTLVNALPLNDINKDRLKLALTGDLLRDTTAIVASLKNEVNSLATAASDYLYVPRYDVQASAGNGAVISDECIVDHLAFKRDWITRTLGLDPQSVLLIDVAGDSMADTINDGDLILIDRRRLPVKTEGIYVFNLSGSLLVKRLRLRLNGVIEVVSDNVRYGIETISGEQLDQLQMVGRVVWQGRRV